MSGNYKPEDEWLKQADYDIGTADAMFTTGRYIYTVFMCHLTIEKVLKGLYVRKFNENPPKTHDLNFLKNKIDLEIPAPLGDFLDELNDLSVPTRYPDELDNLINQYREDRVKKILINSKELLSWLKKR